ncbi:MAG: HIG1 domain-containing protein [Holosporales bacterium]
MLFVLCGIAITGTVLMLSLGLWSFWCGDNGDRSNFWMRSRLLLQGLSLVLLSIALWKRL